MFVIDTDAVDYIRKRSGTVLIRLFLEPAGGGCPCSSHGVTGSYAPVVALGKPPTAELARYEVQQIGDVEVYFPPELRAKEGCEEIRLKLRKVLWINWLELEGARSIVSYV